MFLLLRDFVEGAGLQENMEPYRPSIRRLGVALAVAILTLPIFGQATPPANGQHMSAWMARHADLTLPQMVDALQKEPGFRDLPPQIQQRDLDQLKRLYKQNHAQPPQASPAPHLEQVDGEDS